MASNMQSELVDVNLSSLGRNIIVGTTLGLGIGIGIGTGLFVAQRMTKTMTIDKGLTNEIQQLTKEMKELRSVLSQRQQLNVVQEKIVPVKEQGITENKYSAASLKDLLSLNSDEDDEFFDFNQEDEIQVTESTNSQVVHSSPDSGIKSIIEEYEILDDKSDNDRDINKVHQFLENAVKKNPDCGELLWRLAKSYYEVASEKGKDGLLEEKKDMLYKGLAIAEHSVEVGNRISDAHKWYALILGSTAEYESTQERILLGFKYKEHISKAIEINSKDPSSYHLLGRWCFEVSQLPWWQRQAASAFIAEPPTSTVDEALDNFLKAEHLDPGFWLTNSFWISKCYYEKRQYDECRQWLQKVIKMAPSSPDDEKSLQDAKELLQKV